MFNYHITDGNYTWINFEFPLYSKCNIGVALSLPIFRGMGISAQVEQARATADVAEVNFNQLKKSILLAVEQSLILAEKQYTTDINSTIEVTDAQLALSNACITKIQSLYDYNSFLTRLKRAIGIKLELTTAYLPS